MYQLPSSKWIRSALLVLIFVTVLMFLLAYMEKRRGRLQLAAAKAKIQQAGYPISMPKAFFTNAATDLDLRLLAISQSISSNRPYRIGSLQSLGNGQAARGSQAPHPILDGVKVVLTNGAARIESGEVTTWHIMETLHAENEGALKELREILAQSHDLSGNYSFTNALKIRPVAWGLNDAILRQLYRGELHAAEQNLIALAQLTRVNSDQRNLIPVMVRTAVTGIGTDLLWDALQSDGWTDGQLSHLQNAWATPSLVPDVVQALHFERLYRMERYEEFRGMSYRSWIAKLKRDYAGFGSDVPMYPGWVDISRTYLFHPLWRNLWAEQEMAANLQRTEYLTTVPNQALTARTFAGVKDQLLKHAKPLPGSPGKWKFYAILPLEDDFWEIHSDSTRPRMFSNREMLDRWGADFHVPSFGKAIATVVQNENNRSMAITSIALKRFFIRNGYYPERLEQLVPEFTTELALDWMAGQSLRYHRTSDRTYSLYSIGDDGKDDGGSPETDHVWPAGVPWE